MRSRVSEPADDTSSVTGKVLAILGSFDADHRELTLAEMAHRSGLVASTAHRRAAQLVAWGALERGEDGLYRVGLRLWEVAALGPRGPGLRELALPFLEDLCVVTRQNVQLAVREDLELVFLERLAGRDSVPVLTRVGGRFSLHATGVGLVLLAYAPLHGQEAALSLPLPAYTKRTVIEPDVLRGVLDSIRRKGFAVSDRAVTDDALSVAAPVFGADRTIRAAVSIVVRAETATPHALSDVVRTAARGISRALGMPGSS